MSRILFVALCLAAFVPLAGQSGPPAVTGNARVDRLLSQMTLAEKISMIHGAPEDPSTSQGQAGYLPGVPRLGIPSLRFVDGPPGVSEKVWSTGMTATMGLAATFSRQDARQNGIVIARDARALGQDVVLEPFINMLRDFGFGRGYNTYGEDPLLTGQIGAAMIAGVQSQGVMAQAKHYIAYDGGNDVYVDPQTLHEIYVAPFVDAVNAGVSSIMCSYNLINGVYACGNGDVQNKILRGELGFQGFITSDWGATHSTLFVNQGLDLEMPGGAEGAGGGGGRGSYFLANPPAANPQAGRGPAGGLAGPGGPGGMGGRGGAGMPEERSAAAAGPGAGGGRGGGGGPGRGSGESPIGMLTAVETGKVKEAAITAAVGRILVQMDKFGFLDKAPKHNVTPEDNGFNAPILQKTAEDAAVLLKNRDNILPLTAGDLASATSVAFIGPNAGQLISIGAPGEKAMGIPAHQVSPVAALEKISGRKVTYAPANDMNGVPIPPSALSHGGRPGLLRTDTGTSQTQTDAQLSFTASNGKALPAGSALTWSGTLAVPSEGEYMIALQMLGAGGAVTLDGQAIARVAGAGRGGSTVHPIQDNVLPTPDNLDNARARVALKAGAHELSVTATGVPREPVQVRLNWLTPEQDKANYQAAVNAAKQAKKAVVFAWGRDRPTVGVLPGNQDQLIRDIAAANPNTIVVLNTSQPVTMPWLDQVKAVVEMWWPGDEGGPATANILLGRANPAGRLPFTWPQSLDQLLANDPAHPERSNRGVDGKTTYSEGIFIGYRWFDRQDIKPLYPFGHGLSYTSFEYSGLKVAKAADGGLDVSFAIRNTGQTNGDEAPQVYLGAPDSQPNGAQFAVKALAAFDRVSIPAGQSKSITLHVALRQLQYWSTADNRWATPTGGRTVYVGASSRDIRVTTPVLSAAVPPAVLPAGPSEKHP